MFHIQNKFTLAKPNLKNVHIGKAIEDAHCSSSLKIIHVQ